MPAPQILLDGFRLCRRFDDDEFQDVAALYVRTRDGDGLLFQPSSLPEMETRSGRCHRGDMQQADPRLGEAIALFQAGQESEALARIQQLADAGHADARFTLADCYWRGVGVAQDLVRGRELFGAAAEVSQPMAVRAYTNLLSSGIAGPRDWTRALARLED